MRSSFYTPTGVPDKPWWDTTSNYHYYTTGTNSYPLVLRLMIPANQKNNPDGVFSIYTPHPTPRTASPRTSSHASPPLVHTYSPGPWTTRPAG